jgi:hypothetical protein
LVLKHNKTESTILFLSTLPLHLETPPPVTNKPGFIIRRPLMFGNFGEPTRSVVFPRRKFICCSSSCMWLAGKRGLF